MIRQIFAIVCFSLFTFFSGNTASAQLLQPVKWEATVTETGVNEYTLIFKATIEEGWKVYSHNLPEADIRPIPTTIYFDDLPAEATLLGEMEELGSKKEAVEPLFDNLTIGYYLKRVTLRQKVKITKDVSVKGYIDYMTCDDTKCIPLAFDFSFDLTAAKGVNLIDTETDFGLLKEPVKWTLTTEKITDKEYYLLFNATVAPTWKLYSQYSPEGAARPMKFNFENLNDKTYQLVGRAEEIGALETKKEALFENKTTKYYHEKLTLRQKIIVDSANAIISGFIEYQACDATKCQFHSIDFRFELSGGEIQQVVIVDTLNQGAKIPVVFAVDTSTAGQFDCKISYGATVTDVKNKSLWSTFLLGFIGGLIGLLMPCTFPMIPFTISFFTKRTGDRKKGVFEASFYGFSIVLVYFLASLPFLLFGLGGDKLNEFSTNNVVNLIFFFVFILFALSLFGLFEIRLPTKWANKADSASNVGGLAGIFFMALTLCIVSFSCTGPILGSLLANSLKDGGPALSAGMVGFGVAFALAFTLLALFPQLLNKLPKSGGWLNEVKIVFAFIELAFALKFLSNVDMAYHWELIKYEIFLGFWTLFAFLTFLYVVGVIRFPHDDKKVKFTIPRSTFALFFLLSTIYFAQGLTRNGTVPLLSGFLPPKWYSIYERENECPLGLNCFHDLDEAIQYAQEVNKPILIDFTGYACVNCRKMEENVWPKQAVYKLISEKYVLVSLYVDDKEPLRLEEQYISSYSGSKVRTVGNKWSDFQSSQFGTNSQPYYALVAPDGKVLNYPTVYTPDVDEYAGFLQCGIEAFEQLNSLAGK